MRKRTLYSFLVLIFLIGQITLHSSARGQPLGTFTLSLTPTILSVMEGGSGQVDINVTSVNNFTAPVSLSFSGAPLGVSTTFSNEPVTPPPGGTVSSQAHFTVDSSVPVNTYQMTLLASSGSVVRNYDFSLQVTSQLSPKDFIIVVSPPNVTASPGHSASAIVLITSLNGFSSPVNLTSSGQPPGVTVNFSPNTVTPSAGGYVNSALTVSLANSASQGYYFIMITGSGRGGGSAGVIQHFTGLALQVSAQQDFSITVNPSSISVQQGQSKTAVVIVSAIGGFNAEVGLSTSPGLPPGIQISFSSNPITPGSSTMSIIALSSAITGTFPLQIIGTSGSLSHSTAFTLTISQGAQASFSLSTSYPSITVGQGRSTTAIIILTSIGGFLSSVNTTTTWVGPTPSGVTVSGPGTLTPPPGGSTSGPLIISATSSPTLGTYLLSVIGTSGTLSYSLTLTVTITQGAIADFSVGTEPTVVSLGQGTSGTSIITVQSQDGFDSPVALSASWQGSAPSGVTLNLPSPVTPPPYAAVTSTLTVTAAPQSSVGAYTLAVSGTQGPLIRSANVTVQISATAVTTSTTSSTSTSLTANSTSSSTGGPQCFIATATFGSPLSPEVQFLRNLRDKDIMKTYVGWNFMIAFNAWYYSFSPTVAKSITQHPTLQYGMRVVLYPLIAILTVGATPFTLLPAHAEVAAVLSGLIITSLIGIVYLSLPLTAISLHSRRRRSIMKRAQRVVLAILALSVVGIAVADIATAGPLMILATVSTALSTLLISALVTSEKLLQITSRG